MFKATPLSPSCARLLPGARHACVGVSPFNAYFSAARLTELATWALANFATFHFFVPDEVTAYTLEAMGYPPTRARQKAHRQSCHVHNKIRAALVAAGVPDPGARVLDMASLRQNEHYPRIADEVHEQFETRKEFREACLKASSWVLSGKTPPGTVPSIEQKRLAVRYLLAEIPLFIASAQIVGQQSSMFVYHQKVRFLERLFHREFPCVPSRGQGFLVVEPSGTTPFRAELTPYQTTAECR